jgi:ectoine hydroxylase-related dioxygenase (phytanoyl-CoA dioxygenase family)
LYEESDELYVKPKSRARRRDADIAYPTRVIMPRFPVVRHDSLYNGSTFVVQTDVDVPRFDVGEEAISFLKREGYVVIKSVLNASEVLRARTLLWQYLEGIKGAGISRDEPSTWIRGKPNQYGIFWQHGVGHSQLAWFVRTRPRLFEAFRRYWNTTELLTSFEGFSMLPPARIEDSQWNVAESWFHTDQNAKTRAGRQTVQSFTSLFDQSEATGGFVVVPRSWKSHKKVTARVYRHNPRTADSQQFLMIPPDDPVLSTPHAPHLVRCRAGDAVLWDSRTVHCSTPSLRNVPGIVRSDGSDPARVVVYASMAPRRRASTEVILRRQQALLSRQTCTHWPFEMACLEPPGAMGELPSDPIGMASGFVKSLVGYTDQQIAHWLGSKAHAPSARTCQVADPMAATRAGASMATAAARDDGDPFESPRRLELENTWQSGSKRQGKWKCRKATLASLRARHRC